jgi:hypothetical protein
MNIFGSKISKSASESGVQFSLSFLRKPESVGDETADSCFRSNDRQLKIKLFSGIPVAQIPKKDMVSCN